MHLEPALAAARSPYEWQVMGRISVLDPGRKE